GRAASNEEVWNDLFSDMDDLAQETVAAEEQRGNKVHYQLEEQHKRENLVAMRAQHYQKSMVVEMNKLRATQSRLADINFQSAMEGIQTNLEVMQRQRDRRNSGGSSGDSEYGTAGDDGPREPTPRSETIRCSSGSSSQVDIIPDRCASAQRAYAKTMGCNEVDDIRSGSTCRSYYQCKVNTYPNNPTYRQHLDLCY
ncbi:MAG: hypothetical protein HQL50_15360, partial [Magnetococcales bacterium]|nr:hypothetical protein [Magnetococcales bacterium]